MDKPQPELSVIRTDTSVLVVRIAARTGTAVRFLLRSDAHHDSVHADHELEDRHLREAERTGAYILDFGDLFDAMQGRFDPRRGPDRRDLRPEYWEGHYLDRLVDVAAERYARFASRWLVMSPGNHETGVAKRHEIDLTDRLVRALKVGGAAPLLQRGTYAGWVVFRFIDPDRPKRTAAIKLYYHHGYGGGGPVTRGVIQTSRMGLYLPDADLVVSGHTHDSWQMPIARARLTSHGIAYEDRQTHVRLAGYKGEFLPSEGWAIERGMPPKPRGGAWMTLNFHQAGDDRTVAVQIDEAT